MINVYIVLLQPDHRESMAGLVAALLKRREVILVDPKVMSDIELWKLW